jgi:hypothetical protein
MMEGEHTRPRVLRSAPSRSAGATRQTGADFRKATRQNTEIPVSGEGAGNNTRGRVCSPKPATRRNSRVLCVTNTGPSA